MRQRHDDVFAKLIITSVAFILVHTPNGAGVGLQIDEISSIREITEQEYKEKAYGDGVHCVIIMTNGKSIGIAEECQEVGDRITDAERKAKHIVEEPKA